MNHFLLVGLLWFCSSAIAGIPTEAASHLFDLTGSADKPMSLPTDVAVSDNGLIYVVDSGNSRIVVFSPRGSQINAFSGPGKGQGLLQDPVGLDIDQNGNVYVADKGNFRISIFSADGAFRKVIPLTVEDSEVAPVDVATMPDGRSLVVTGNKNHQVMVFDIDGSLIRAWGGSGVNKSEFRYPATVAIDASASIYVVDVLNTRLQKFGPQGEYLVQFGQWGVKPGELFRPKGVALDNAQQVYISDSYLGIIQVFDNESRFQYVLGHDGAPERFSAPTGIAVDANNNLYVAEMLANKVSVYSLKTEN